MKTLYQNIKIPALTGKKTLAKSGWSYVDSDFGNWNLDKRGKESPEQELAVLEMDTNGTFQQIFSSINPDMNSMVLTQEQIIYFCENKKNQLRDEYYGTFFLFKVGDEFFVAHVRVRVGCLKVYADRFSRAYVWYAEFRHRIVVPQLALKTSPSATPRPSDSLNLEAAIKLCKDNGLVVYKPQ